MPESDLHLLSRLLAGDPQAWEAFVEKFTPFMYSAILSVLQSRTGGNPRVDPQDVYQRVLLLLMENNFEKLRQYKGLNNAKLSTWLAVVSTRMALNSVRAESRHRGQEKGEDILREYPGDKGNFLDNLEGKEVWGRIREAMREGLTHQERFLLRLFLEKELPAEEIAAVMKIQISYVYVIKNRALQKIRKKICKKDIFPVSYD